MLKDTHFLIVRHILGSKYVRKELRNFIRPMCDDEIAFYSWISDELDRDNLEYGYWYHSYKLRETSKGDLELVRGALPLAIGALYWDCKNKYREGNFTVCRQNLIKISHYTIDSCSMPHVVEKEADFIHKTFEEDIDKTIDKTLREITQLKIEYALAKEAGYINIDKRVDMWCHEIYKKYKEKIIRLYKNKENINDSKYDKLRREIIKDCCIWTLEVLQATYEHMMFPPIARY